MSPSRRAIASYFATPSRSPNSSISPLKVTAMRAPVWGCTPGYGLPFASNPIRFVCCCDMLFSSSFRLAIVGDKFQPLDGTTVKLVLFEPDVAPSPELHLAKTSVSDVLEEVASVLDAGGGPEDVQHRALVPHDFF